MLRPTSLLVTSLSLAYGMHMPQERIGRYEIIGELGKGAMGVVYKATDPNIGRTVALKTMRVDVHGLEAEEMLGRFQNEARAAGLLSHPNIVTIYDAGEHEGIFYIAMEFMEGRTLQQILREQRVLPPDLAVSIIRQVCAGLDYAHARGVIHRDVKPANIMVAADGSAKIMDFGIAKSGGTGLTSTGQVVGTPNYMSPEQVKGRKLDGRSDLFSLGVILYECLTGERPFAGDNVTTIIYKIVNEKPPAPCALDAAVPAQISGVVMRALAKTPETRYQSGADLAYDLEHGVSAAPAEMAPAAVAAAENTGASAASVPAAAPQRAPLNSPVARAAPPPAPAAARQSSPTLAIVVALLAIVVGAGAYIGIRWKLGQAAAGPPADSAQPPASSTVNPPSETTAKPAPAKPADAAAPATGELQVTSKPAGAKVEVDGRGDPQWLTPVTVPGLTLGAHQVTVALDGYTPESKRVDIAAGKRATLRAELAAIKAEKAADPLPQPGPNPFRRLKRLFGGAPDDRGTLQVRTLPRGAEIWFNGKPTPRRTPTRVPLPVGTYRIGLRLPGYKPVERTVTIEKGKMFGVEEVLEKQ